MPNLNDIHLLLGQVKATQDAHSERFDSFEAKLDSLDHKVSGHENLKNRLLGACAVLSIGIGLFMDGIKDAATGLFKGH